LPSPGNLPLASQQLPWSSRSKALLLRLDKGEEGGVEVRRGRTHEGGFARVHAGRSGCDREVRAMGGDAGVRLQVVVAAGLLRVPLAAGREETQRRGRRRVSAGAGRGRGFRASGGV